MGWWEFEKEMGKILNKKTKTITWRGLCKL